MHRELSPIFDRQLAFQRRISFHPKLAPALHDVLDQLPPRQSTMIRAAALYSKPEIPWLDLHDGTHEICVSGRPDDGEYLYALAQAWQVHRSLLNSLEYSHSNPRQIPRPTMSRASPARWRENC